MLPPRFISGFLILMMWVPSFAQSVIILNKEEGVVPIGKKTLYLEDASLQLSINEILLDENPKQFIPYEQNIPHFGSSASAYWLKFEIEKTQNANFYLEVGSAYMDSIALYEVDQTGRLITARFSGDDLPFDQREIKVGNFLFALDFPVGEIRTFYLRIKCFQPLYFPLRTGTLDKFMEVAHDKDYMQGIYFGFMLLIFLYNLFLYFTLREKIYLYYIAYVISMTWFMASAYGYFFEYFWPETPIINQNVVVSTGLTMITATLFTQKFLNTRATSLRLHYGASVFGVIGLVVSLLVFFDLKIIGLKMSQIGLLLMANYFLFLGIYFLMKGFRAATYYLLAWITLIIGMTFAILETINLFPIMEYVHYMQVGSGVEVLLLSFALGDRINTYKREKEEAQRQALEEVKKNEKLIREQNVILDNKVNERTEELAQANKNLKKSYDELQKLDDFKESMTSMIVHDFKNSLNTVINFSKGKPTEQGMKSIRHAGRFMLNMAMNILDVQKFEETNPKLSLAKYPLGLLIEEAVDQLTYVMEQKSIKLEFKQKADFMVNVDENLMVRLIVNILSNAIKYSPINGTITISTVQNDQKVQIAVTDEGSGIPADKLDLVFNKYAQVEARKQGAISSTGLGLTFCKMVAEAHKGDIGVNSREGVGSTFYFSLPLFDTIEETKAFSEKINVKEVKKLVLSANEKKMLKPLLEEIQKWDVFDYSEVMAVLEKIEPNGENIEAWKETIVRAVKNGNEEIFKELIDQ